MEERGTWWREAKFGMFIHWGLYALLAGSYGGRESGGNAEWIMHDFAHTAGGIPGPRRALRPGGL